MKFPLVYKLRPQFGDTDAAQIVFTGKIADYVLAAIDEFMREVVKASWFELNIDNNMGTPFVSVKFDMFAPLSPRGEISCSVYVVKLGNSSMTFRVLIHNHEGVKCVDATTVNVFVSNKTMTKIDIPKEYRDRMNAYMNACEAPA